MPNNTYVTTKPQIMEGYQSVFEANDYNKCTLQLLIDDEHIEALEKERPELLKWAKSKCKAPANRVNVRLEPWEPVEGGRYKVRFSWNPEIKVPIVDSNGTPVTQSIPLYSGSTVKVAFEQKPYALPDSVGTTLRLKAIQIVSSHGGGGGSDSGTMTAETAATLFGVTEGFKVDDPNVKFEEKEEVKEDNDF